MNKTDNQHIVWTELSTGKRKPFHVGMFVDNIRRSPGAKLQRILEFRDRFTGNEHRLGLTSENLQLMIQIASEELSDQDYMSDDGETDYDDE